VEEHELEEIETLLDETLEAHGLGWVSSDLRTLLREEPERIDARRVTKDHDRRVARLMLLLEAVQRVAQTAVACETELAAASERRDLHGWVFVDEETDEEGTITEPSLMALGHDRHEALRGLAQAIGELQRELAGELRGGGGLTDMGESARRESELRESNVVSSLWSDVPDLRYLGRDRDSVSE
jgi:hypothetical protein